VNARTRIIPKPAMNHINDTNRPVLSRSNMPGRLTACVFLGAAALICPASAQPWTTVDDSLGVDSYARGLAKDPSGTIIYSAGDGLDSSGRYHAVAFKSIDGGTTWSLLDDYSDPASPSGGYGPGYDAGIAADPFGNLYAAGFENFPDGTYP